MDERMFYLGFWLYARNLFNRVGWKVNSGRAAKRITAKAWEAHQTNGRSFADTFAVGMMRAQRKFGYTQLN